CRGCDDRAGEEPRHRSAPGERRRVLAGAVVARDEGGGEARVVQRSDEGEEQVRERDESEVLWTEEPREDEARRERDPLACGRRDRERCRAARRSRAESGLLRRLAHVIRATSASSAAAVASQVWRAACGRARARRSARSAESSKRRMSAAARAAGSPAGTSSAASPTSSG